MTTSSDTKALVAERGKTHGAFEDHAAATQRLKSAFYREHGKRQARNQTPLSETQLEAVEMILHKLGRIVAGDPNFADHWDDIAGYAVIANRTKATNPPPPLDGDED